MPDQTEKSTAEDPQNVLVGFIEKEIEHLEIPMELPFIRRVPKEFCNGDKKIFEPISITIGPLHHQLEEKSAKEFKKWCLKNFIDGVKKHGVTKEKVVHTIVVLLKQIKECYADLDEGLTDSEFAKIVLLDGCFIIELLLHHKEFGKDMLGESKEKVPLVTLQQDLLKIENQLPFMVLKNLATLYKKFMQVNEGTEWVINLTLEFFNIPKPANLEDNPRHLLELVLNALFPTNNEDPTSNHIHLTSDDDVAKCLKETNNASTLKRHGVKLEVTDCAHGLTMVKFKNGTLRIPQLVVQESTKTVFWNFLVFEMYSCPSSRIFASYVVLIDTLIDSVEDVKVLLNAKILVSRNNDVQSLVSLFNDLSAYVSQKGFCFEPLVSKMNRYCRSCWPSSQARFKKKYHECRWDAVNSILIIILTVTQTMIAGLSYNPKGR